MIWISPFTGVSWAARHHQSQSPRTNKGSRCRGLHTPSLGAVWTLPFPMPVLSAVGTLGISQLQWISKIVFSSLLSPWLLHSGRMNQGQDFSLLSGQGLGLPLYPPSLSGFLLLPFDFLLPVSIQKYPICLLHQIRVWGLWSFPSFCNFLLMSGSAWVMKE